MLDQLRPRPELVHLSRWLSGACARPRVTPTHASSTPCGGSTAYLVKASLAQDSAEEALQVHRHATKHGFGAQRAPPLARQLHQLLWAQVSIGMHGTVGRTHCKPDAPTPKTHHGPHTWRELSRGVAVPAAHYNNVPPAMYSSTLSKSNALPSLPAVIDSCSCS